MISKSFTKKGIMTTTRKRRNPDETGNKCVPSNIVESQKPGRINNNNDFMTGKKQKPHDDKSPSAIVGKCFSTASEDAGHCYHYNADCLTMLHVVCDEPTREVNTQKIWRLALNLKKSCVTPTQPMIVSSRKLEEKEQQQVVGGKKNVYEEEMCVCQDKPSPSSNGCVSSVFADIADGRTPLHRACCNDASSGCSCCSMSNHSSDVDEPDFSEMEEEEEEENYDEDHNQYHSTDRPASPAKLVGSVPEQITCDKRSLSSMLTVTAETRQKPTTTTAISSGEEADGWWLFETTCILLGLCPSMGISQDRLGGETPLHILARRQIVVNPLDSLSQKIPTNKREDEDNIQNDNTTILLRMTASAICKACPQVLKVKDRCGNTPLHRRVSTILIESDGVCGQQHRLDTLTSFLVQADPEVLSMKNDSGMTPLHLACHIFASRQSFPPQQELQCDSENKNKGRETPTISDYASSAFRNLIILMVQTNPEALCVRDDEFGFTPLHCLCETPSASFSLFADDGMICELVQCILEIETCWLQQKQQQHEKPSLEQDTKTPSPSGDTTPTSNDQHDNVLKKSAAFIRDCRGFTPLHLSCLNTKSPLTNLIHVLATCRPDASTMLDYTGKTPLRQTCHVHRREFHKIRHALRVPNREDATEQLRAVFATVGGAIFMKKIRFLLQSSWMIHCQGRRGQISSTKGEARIDNDHNNESWFDVHMAASCPSCPPALLEMIVRLNPERLRMRDQYGDLPIHVAARVYQVHEDGHKPGNECRMLDDQIFQSLRASEENAHRPSPITAPTRQTVSRRNASTAMLSRDDSEDSSEGSSSPEDDTFTETMLNPKASAQFLHDETNSGDNDEDDVPDDPLEDEDGPTISPINVLLDNGASPLDHSDRLDGEGRHALHIALDDGRLGMDEGIRSIITSDPEALGIRDPSTGLFPFMIPAAKSSFSLKEEKDGRDVSEDVDWDMERLNTSFVLLSSKPELVSCGV